MTFAVPCAGVLVATVDGDLDLTGAREPDTKIDAELHRQAR